MNTTISTWLGALFLLLAITAVLPQAWLWGPRFWDEEANKTRAPRRWLRLHAACGYAYAAIYLVMMWHMLPRLWQYQYELPARTIFHAVAALSIGVLLFSKIIVLKFFRHFEEAMPKFGFGLLLSTVILTSLSLPFALRAHDIRGRTLEPRNVKRVERLIAELDFGAEVRAGSLTTEAAFDRGRQVLVNKCTVCHDLRTILVKPRTARRWLDVTERMLSKPAVVGEPLVQNDIPPVTAYLVAITPDIQESTKRRREERRGETEREQRTQSMMAELAADAGPAATPPEAIGHEQGEKLLETHCTDCHELDEVTAHGRDDVAGWTRVIVQMIEEGAEIPPKDAEDLTRYLATRPAK